MGMEVSKGLTERTRVCMLRMFSFLALNSQSIRTSFVDCMLLLQENFQQKFNKLSKVTEVAEDEITEIFQLCSFYLRSPVFTPKLDKNLIVAC